MIAMKRFINVSNRLPVTVGKTMEKSSGGLASALEGIEQDFDFRWIGWAGRIVDDAAERDRISARLVEQFGYLPLFLSKQEKSDYYNGFANTTLWPLMHYHSQFSGYEERWYEQYLAVNRRFAQAVDEAADQGDIIWVHDYHLMLVPKFLRERRPDLRIGFFLHTPFPSYEIFRCHPNREELLEGLLGADLIGFQAFGYLRHFRSTVLRILGLESEIGHIVSEQHVTKIGVYPIGINSSKFLQEMQTEQFWMSLNEFRQAYQGKTVILNLERLDYTKGLPHKLNAIEKFLMDVDEDVRDSTVFIFIAIPSRIEVKEYTQLLQEIERRVSQLNGRYSTLTNTPIHFVNKSISSFSELCALYSLADVAMVTPLIDGMNLVAKEYIACQQEKQGVLVLSEFAGAAQELPNALIVNPYNHNQVANSLHHALTLSEAEKEKMIQPMRERVLKYDARHWAKTFIDDLAAEVPKENLPAEISMLNREAAMPLFSALNPVLFLDYDGTLAELKKRPAEALPDEQIKALFQKMDTPKGPDIFLISGRKHDDMEQWFANYDFNLIAEHGYYHKLSGKGEWEIFDPQADLSWKSQIIDVLQLYTGMTPGSFVEEKTASVVWHYRNADPEFGSWKANQLVAELYEMLSNLPVEIHHGKKIVEISSILINKGIVMEYFVQLKNYDAVLCAGDDETDESMFRLSDDKIISIKVGSGMNTAARYRIPGVRAFRAFLNELMESMPAS
jgi:trehalose 6-phosphate synthase/phosphatase